MTTDSHLQLLDSNVPMNIPVKAKHKRLIKHLEQKYNRQNSEVNLKNFSICLYIHLYTSCFFIIFDTPFIQNLKNNHMHRSQEDLLSACLKFGKAQLQQYVSLNCVSASSTDNK